MRPRPNRYLTIDKIKAGDVFFAEYIHDSRYRCKVIATKDGSQNAVYGKYHRIEICSSGLRLSELWPNGCFEQDNYNLLKWSQKYLRAA